MRYLTSLGKFLRTTSLIVGNTIILLIICMLVGEWWARRNRPPAEQNAARITVFNQHAAYHPWAGFRNTPGFRYELGKWVPTVVNSWGWRGPEPSIERSKSVKRAFLLGDSSTFSCWGCRDEISTGGALRRALEQRTGEEWEVINASVPGGFSHLSLATLAHDGIQFKPDVVITLNGINDTLVLGEVMMLRMGGGLFKHSIYHKSQIDLANAFDARTGRVDRFTLLSQLANESALFQLITSSPLFAGLRPSAPANPQQAAPTATGSIYSTAHPERLDAYINNEIAMSFLTAGSGAKFVGFLQPYFSIKHKVLGEADKVIVKQQQPELLAWMDEVYPILRAKLQKAAADHPSFNFVDLSLLFIHEQAFDDLAHLKYEGIERSMATDVLTARMADEIIKVVYAGQALPDWRKTHLAGTPHDWNEPAYLAANPDAAALVAEGKYKSGYEHYRAVGFYEFRIGGFPHWNEKAYLEANPEVATLVTQKQFASGYDHYLKKGKAEGRRKGLPLRFTEGSYLAANPDVATAINQGAFKSGEEHFAKIGAAEDRKGAFSGWDDEQYLVDYQDVRLAVIGNAFSSGFEHFMKSGRREGRAAALGLPSIN